jgi:hypothetical protein
MFQLPDPPPNSGSSLHNIVNSNFESGPLDTFPDFDFTSEQILSFVNLNSPRLQSNETNGLLPSFEEPENVTETRGHDLVSWLQVNHADNSPTVSSGSQQIPGSNTASAPLIEPGPSKDMFVHQEKPERCFLIDSNLYNGLVEMLNTATQVFFSLIELIGRTSEVEDSPSRVNSHCSALYLSSSIVFILTSPLSIYLHLTQPI